MEFQALLLGPPTFFDGARPIEFHTRKAAALCTFLAASGARPVERQRLSGLLWGNFPTEQARASLRKAVSMLASAPETGALIGKDRASVWYAGDPMRVDLAAFRQHLAVGTERAYRQALALWTDEPLVGLELGEPIFDEWVAQFRAITVTSTHQQLSERLSQMQRHGTSAGHEIALCELIVRVEPSDTIANQRLIELHVERGELSAAMKRVRAFAAALDELEVPLPTRLRTLARRISDTASSEFGAPPMLADEGQPRVALMPLDPPAGAGRHGRAVHTEIVCQLTRFRTLRLHERSVAGGAFSVGPEHGDDYQIEVIDEPLTRHTLVKCVNVRSGHTVSATRIADDLVETEGAETAVAGLVNALEQDVLNDAPVTLATPYSRWLEAYRLLERFTAEADAAAFALLQQLASEPGGKHFSPAYGSMAAVMLRRRLIVPGHDTEGKSIRRAIEHASHAATLDRYEPFNHVVLGWAHLQRGEPDRAMAELDTAAALNPYSSRVLISVAAASACCGNLQEAGRLAARAQRLAGRYVPPYAHNYLASIAYARGELEDCVRHLNRAPQNAQWAILSIAAHQERGDLRTAASAKLALENVLRAVRGRRANERTTLSRWLAGSVLPGGEGSRARLFGALRSAGLELQDLTA